MKFMLHVLSDSEKRQMKLTPQQEKKLEQSTNALDVYDLAFRVLKDPEHLIGKSSDSHLSFPLKVSPKIAAVVKANRRSLLLLRRGLGVKIAAAKVSSGWAEDDAYALSDHFPILAAVKHLAKFACASGDSEASAGHLPEALNDYLMAYDLGGQFLDQGSTLIDSLVGIAVEAISLSHLKNIAPGLDVHLAEAASRHLAETSAHRRSEADQVRSEVLYAPKFRLRAEDIKELPEKERKEAANLPALLKARDDLILERLKAYSAPFANRGPAPHPPESFMAENPDFKEIADMSTTFDQFWFSSLRQQTVVRLLAMKMAAIAFQKEHHRSPTSLKDLAPSVLQAAPEDPFYPGAKLRMVTRDGNLIFYSVGPDGKDDGGKAVVAKRNNQVLPESIGDIIETQPMAR